MEESKQLINKAISYIKKTGTVLLVKETPIEYIYTPTDSHESYIFTISIIDEHIYIYIANKKIKLELSKYKSTNEPFIYIHSYYSSNKRDDKNKNEPKLDIIRTMLKHFKHISLWDVSTIECKNRIFIPYMFIAFVNYPRLQLYEGIVDTPDISKEIRDTLKKHKMLYSDICDVTIDGLEERLQFLSNVPGLTFTSIYKKSYKYILSLRKLNTRNISQFLSYSIYNRTLQYLSADKYKVSEFAILNNIVDILFDCKRTKNVPVS